MKLAVESYPAVTDKQNIVGTFLKVGDNMRREKNGLSLPCKVEKHIKQLLARYRIKSARRLIEYQKTRTVRKRKRETELDPHAFRQLLGRFACIERKHIGISAPHGIIPARVK